MCYVTAFKELSSPEDCKMLNVEEHTIEDTGQNDNSTIFSSEMEVMFNNCIIDTFSFILFL